ncbi:MAG: class I SAM-dependent methyltransferase [Thermonemataceae bacterium]
MFSTTEITSAEITSDNPVHQRLFFAYVEAAKMIKGNLLEVGCGVGRGLSVLLNACEHYTAIDKNEQLIEALQQHHSAHTFIAMNIPPFKNIQENTFDFLVSFQVIEHIQNDALFVEEIHRVLKPGGKAIITTPNIHLSLTRNPWHIREYTAEALFKLLDNYFPTIDMHGVAGNEKVITYYEENKKAVAKLKKLDIFNLEKHLPRKLLQIPYDILNRRNRKKLMNQENSLANDITHQDYYLSDQPSKSLDLFYIATK